MHRWAYLIFMAIAVITATPTLADNLSSLVGTMEVQFMPMQSAGIRHGCTLVYRAVARDHAYLKGNLISLSGNIAYSTNKNRSDIWLTLKVGTIDDLTTNSKPERPFFAYIQTRHATTAKSSFLQFDSDTPGFRLFVYQLDDGVMKVYEDIINGASVTIGFNRNKDGLDVLVPIDLSVAETTISADG